jgi:hypothetical protein
MIKNLVIALIVIAMNTTSQYVAFKQILGLDWSPKVFAAGMIIVFVTIVTVLTIEHCI